MLSKIGLGTAQFGMDYGISNQTGQVSKEEILNILHHAFAQGVRLLDTAHMYGASESELGKVLAEFEGYFQIVTKTPSFAGEELGAEHVNRLTDAFSISLDRLKLKSVYALLVHNADDLLKPGGKLIIEKMQDMRRAGKVKKVGVSVYSPEQIRSVMSKYSVDIVQAPFNIFDQRLQKEGMLNNLKSSGVELHVRSVFLQGLLLMQPDKLNLHFDSIKKKLKALHKKADLKGLTILEACVGFVTSFPEIDAVICGVSSCHEFEQVVAAAQNKIEHDWFDEFSVDDESILHPSQWRTD